MTNTVQDCRAFNIYIFFLLLRMGRFAKGQTLESGLHEFCWNGILNETAYPLDSVVGDDEVNTPR